MRLIAFKQVNFSSRTFISSYLVYLFQFQAKRVAAVAGAKNLRVYLFVCLWHFFVVSLSPLIPIRPSTWAARRARIYTSTYIYKVDLCVYRSSLSSSTHSINKYSNDISVSYKSVWLLLELLRLAIQKYSDGKYQKLNA